MHNVKHHQLTFHKDLEDVVYAPGDAHMMMLDFPMLNALESQMGKVFLDAFQALASTVIHEYLQATSIAEPVVLDAIWMGTRLALSSGRELSPANQKRLTDHLKTSIEMMGEIRFKQGTETTSIYWRTRPYLATINNYRLMTPESMLEELSFALFDLKLQDMKSQKISTAHLIPGYIETMEDWTESKGAALEINRERQWNRMGRALEIAMVNYEVPVAFHPIFEYDSKLISGIRAELQETDLLLGDPNSPDFDSVNDVITMSPTMMREVASHNSMAWHLDLYLAQESLSWFSEWRANPDRYMPVRLYLSLPITYLQPETEVLASLERMFSYHAPMTNPVTILLEPSPRDHDDLSIKGIKKIIASFEQRFDVQFSMDRVTLHGHFNQLSAKKHESLWQDLGLKEVRISSEWVDLPANQANISLLQLMVQDLRNDRVECVAPAGLTPVMHKHMHDSGVRAYESNDPEAPLTPEKTESLLHSEHTRMHRNVISAANLFRSRAS